MGPWFWTVLGKISTFASGIADDTNKTIEARIICYILLNLFGFTWLSIALYYHPEISSSWATCFCAMCTLDAVATINFTRGPQ